MWYLLEYGVYPPNQKLSGRYPPAVLMRNIVAENPVLVRKRLAELYRSGSDLITTLNRILSVDELRYLLRDLQELNESEWTLLENTEVRVSDAGRLSLPAVISVKIGIFRSQCSD
jgi:hypothetical protein